MRIIRRFKRKKKNEAIREEIDLIATGLLKRKGIIVSDANTIKKISAKKNYCMSIISIQRKPQEKILEPSFVE